MVRSLVYKRLMKNCRKKQSGGIRYRAKAPQLVDTSRSCAGHLPGSPEFSCENLRISEQGSKRKE
ncbi:hypothetical protein MPTK1_5g14350 [Marchantia polymorpha subsp. ruderalis]|uniref:Uncharacterized protein n=2 Tax=Marchantia polymorpha TaxID=3197 RepID=A0AAF6BIA6_MARPO|nr:hypothetical protein MARPO_0032s0127 [Marchantia polymorpha]BBN11740.1 hypothetical protein Mp_5g14350 [Marchantia polymorpha subsp. ruderalis]|eukprot:PTQ41957.1 hypothetical protein MARPO_0032s0127 [Marchantia polymorpha]